MTKSCVTAAGIYCGLGMSIPIAPTASAILAVVIVRVISWRRNQSIKWNIAVCLLAMLAAFSTMEGTELSVFYAFWMGVGYGGLGVGIIEIGKSTITKALTERFQNAAAVLFGVKTKEEE